MPNRLLITTTKHSNTHDPVVRAFWTAYVTKWLFLLAAAGNGTRAIVFTDVRYEALAYATLAVACFLTLHAVTHFLDQHLRTPSSPRR